MLIAQTTSEIQSWLTPLGVFMSGLAALLLALWKIISTLRLSKTRQSDAQHTPLKNDIYLDFITSQIKTWWNIQFYCIFSSVFIMLVGPMAAHPIHTKSELIQSFMIGLTITSVALLVSGSIFCKTQIDREYQRRENRLTSR